MTISNLQGRWNVLLALATAVCTVISGFLKLPQIGADTVAWSKFGIVAVALLVGLWLVPMQIYAVRRFLSYWMIAAVVFFAASAVLYFVYSNALEQWTFAYPADDSLTRVVAGVTLSPLAAQKRDEAKRNGKIMTDHDLLNLADGQMVDVWPNDKERDSRLNWLIEIYLLELLLLPSAIVTVVQASFCATAPPAAGGTA